MKIYPNPSGGKFTFEYQGTMHDNATIFIVDMLGKVLNSKEVVGFDGFFIQEFDLNDFNPGLYAVIIRSEGQTSRKQLILTR